MTLRLPGRATDLLRPSPADEMDAFEVSKALGNVKKQFAGFAGCELGHLTICLGLCPLKHKIVACRICHASKAKSPASRLVGFEH